jgi:serine phosphatase RsbU (regulator of sigma subunit)
MAANWQMPWYLRRPESLVRFQLIPFSRLWSFFVAVITLFSTFGFYGDLMNRGHLPFAVLLVGVLWSGLTSAIWFIFLARLRVVFLIFPAALSVSSPWVVTFLQNRMARMFPMRAVSEDTGIYVSATGIMVLILISYVFFITFIRKEGQESFKLRNELELAHGIQQTLVPAFTLRTARFEIYGISEPSDKVGGDLVDAVRLPGGDAIAYLGDIAGHGLQAGILMGMLKTATRTALLDAGEREPGQTLPVLLDRLNRVLPSVKEPHMFATFTGFRLGADGSVFYALAASTPVLHWHANGLAMSKVEEEQFPLGLLPVPQFDGRRMQMERNDLLVVATDGILEVCGKGDEEFGIERLELAITAHSAAALPELAERILEAARAFGKQVDDQTILLIRCL